MIEKVQEIEEITASIYDYSAVSYGASAGLTTAGVFLSYLPTFLNIALSIVGLTIGCYTIMLKRRQLKDLEKGD